MSHIHDCTNAFSINALNFSKYMYRLITLSHLTPNIQFDVLLTSPKQ